MRLALALILMSTSAHAERYVVQRGETLEHVAQAHGCGVDAIMRANGVRTTLVAPGTSIEIPKCSIRARARVRSTRSNSDDDKARAALATIDGASWTAPPPMTLPSSFARLREGDGYLLRRPQRAYGEPHVVDHLRRCIAEVRALYPDVHTLAIGDLSGAHGGKLDNHVSHQKGLDVDIGFYFQRVPEGYPDRFAAASKDLDLQATWALLTAFARTAERDDGAEVMFLDYAVQRRLYEWARKRGTPDDDLEHLFQYPRGKDVAVGMIRHWPNHSDHVHVRFKTAR